jgi:hypothetical protein
MPGRLRRRSRRTASGCEQKRVSDGIRTRDRRDHNPELYQLSYAHHVAEWEFSERSGRGSAAQEVFRESQAFGRGAIGVALERQLPGAQQGGWIGAEQREQVTGKTIGV